MSVNPAQLTSIPNNNIDTNDNADLNGDNPMLDLLSKIKKQSALFQQDYNYNDLLNDNNFAHNDNELHLHDINVNNVNEEVHEVKSHIDNSITNNIVLPIEMNNNTNYNEQEEEKERQNTIKEDEETEMLRKIQEQEEIEKLKRIQEQEEKKRLARIQKQRQLKEQQKLLQQQKQQQNNPEQQQLQIQPFETNELNNNNKTISEENKSFNKSTFTNNNNISNINEPIQHELSKHSKSNINESIQKELSQHTESNINKDKIIIPPINIPNNNNETQTIPQPQFQSQPQHKSQFLLNISTQPNPPSLSPLLKEEFNSYLSSLNSSSQTLINKITQAIFSYQPTEYSEEHFSTFEYISSFDTIKEKVYGEDIPNYKMKVLFNHFPVEWKKRMSFLNKKYFSGLCNPEDAFQSAITAIKQSHSEFLTLNYTTNKDTLLKNINLIPIDTILTPSSLYPADYTECPIGNVESIETFLYQYSLYNNIKTVDKTCSLFQYWRHCLNDGNSFYRAVMFSVLQLLIMQMKVNELKEIVCEMCLMKYKEVFIANGIDVSIVYSVLSAIITLLEEGNDKEKALQYLIQAYLLKENHFDLAMIVYYRQLCYEYLKETYEIIKQENDKEVLKQLINIESVLVLGKEPEFVLVMLLPYIFNINLKLIWIDGTPSKHNTGYVNLSEETNRVLPIIYIGFFFSSYYPLYPFSPQDELNINEHTPHLSRLTYISKERSMCEVCKDNTLKVYLLCKRCYMCVECLNAQVNAILSKRAVNLYKNKYNGFEYYTQAIPLKGNYSLNNREFMELYSDNYILNSLNEFICGLCFSCFENKDKCELNVLKCSCRYCKTCLQIKIEKATKGLYVLNQYEKSNFEKMICECNNDFNVEEAIDLIQVNDKETKTNEAKERMKRYVETKCALCGNDVKKYKEGDTPTMKDCVNNHVVNIQEENDVNKDIDYVDSEHLICENCMKTMTCVKEKQNTLTCVICDKEHIVNDEMFVNGLISPRKRMKDENGGCCNDKCIVC